MRRETSLEAVKIPPKVRGERLAGSARQFQRDPIGFLSAVREEYGDVVQYRMGWWNFYLFSHPDHIRHILVENIERYGGFLADRVVARVFGRGLFMSEGETWSRHRRMMQAPFHRDRAPAIGPSTIELTCETLKKWQVFAENQQPVEVLREMMSLTLRVAVRELFGIGIGEETRAVTQSVIDILDYFGYRIARLPFVPPVFVPTARNRKFRKALKTLEDTVGHIIDTRRRRLGTEAGDDLLSTLMMTEDKETGYRMNNRQIRDEVMAMVFMSHEPTADVLTWAWYLLSQNPAAEQRLHGELDGVLGGRTPTVADLSMLPYTKRVIEETMRLYPPGWLLGRRALTEDNVGGYLIPRKSIVVFSPYLTHRHPGFWQNPESFDPDRFIPERSAGRPRFAYFPFGGGPHVCIGNHFAMVEAHLILAMIAQRYRLRLLAGHPVEPDAQITLRPRHGMRMMIESRQEVPVV